MPLLQPAVEELSASSAAMADGPLAVVVVRLLCACAGVVAAQWPRRAKVRVTTMVMRYRRRQRGTLPGCHSYNARKASPLSTDVVGLHALYARVERLWKAQPASRSIAEDAAAFLRSVLFHLQQRHAGGALAAARRAFLEGTDARDLCHQLLVGRGEDPTTSLIIITPEY